MAAVPNEFLLAAEHQGIFANCFCTRCREGKANRLRENTSAELYEIIQHLPLKEEARLDRHHKVILDLIVARTVYKEVCLRESQYVRFGNWAKRQPEFSDWSEKDLKKFVVDINQASTVFNKWETIVDNLTDSRMSRIDARRFSVNYFCLAVNIDWCLNYNEILRGKGKRKRDEEPLYPEDKYQAIFRNIVDSGILDDIENSPQVGSMIGSRLQNDIVRLCRQRYQPY